MKRLPIRAKMTLVYAVIPVLAAVQSSRAQDAAQVKSAATFAVKGAVRASNENNAAAPSGMVQQGGVIITDRKSETSLLLDSIGTVKLGPETEVRMPDATEKGHSLELLKGRLFLNISADDLKKRAGTATPQEFRLKTPAALLAVKGTKFFAITDKRESSFGVTDGSVSVQGVAGADDTLLVRNSALTVRKAGAGKLRALTPVESRLMTENTPADLAKVMRVVTITAYIQPNGPLFENINAISSKRTLQIPCSSTGNSPDVAIESGRVGYGPDSGVVSGPLGKRFNETPDFQVKTQAFRNAVALAENPLHFSPGKSAAIYDAGQVAMEAVKKGEESSLKRDDVPCIPGHAYVLRTAGQAWIKFAVESVTVEEFSKKK